MANDLYKEVTDRIIAQLRAGVVPWRKPWTGQGFGGMPRNGSTDRAYSGVNIVLLWITADERGYTDPRWLTFKQAQELGGTVRKGEKGTRIVFVSHIEKTDEETGKPVKIPFLKSYTVFNVVQCDGLPQTIAPKVEATNPEDRDATIDEFITSTGAVVRHGEARAYYASKGDFINLPPFETFTAAGTYYATAFHELGHWTGAEHRLNREFGKRFGDQAYSAEELVAELTSAFLCAEFGIDNDGADAAYIDHWIKFLSDHSKAIIAASSGASKACDYLRQTALAEPVKAAA